MGIRRGLRSHRGNLTSTLKDSKKEGKQRWRAYTQQSCIAGHDQSVALSRELAERGPGEQDRPHELSQVFIIRVRDNSKVLSLRDEQNTAN